MSDRDQNISDQIEFAINYLRGMISWLTVNEADEFIINSFYAAVDRLKRAQDDHSSRSELLSARN